MVHEGACIIDVGGQSTRPGAHPVSLEEERARVLPVLEAIREALSAPAEASSGTGILLSLDTDKPELAKTVFGLGLADIINDLSGGDTAMAQVALRYHAPLILMHRPKGEDRGGISAVIEDLDAIRRCYETAGMPRQCIALDPGIGFGKNEEESLLLLSQCRRLLDLGAPLCIGASRKRVIGRYSDHTAGAARSAAQGRLGGSVAAALWAASCGAAILRVHDVKETVEALAMTAALQSALATTAPQTTDTQADFAGRGIHEGQV